MQPCVVVADWLHPQSYLGGVVVVCVCVCVCVYGGGGVGGLAVSAVVPVDE